MTEGFAQASDVDPDQVALRLDLARADMVIDSIGPVLRYLLASDEQTIFADDVIATVRGMLSDVARQLLAAGIQAGGALDLRADSSEVEALCAKLIGTSEVLTHVHALALEAQLSARLESRLGIDPVLSSLLQALIGANAAEVSTTAMAFLAAQARFVQNSRRMQLPLSELPADVLHAALMALRDIPGSSAHEDAATTIRARYDENLTRLGLIARLITGLGGGVTAALSVAHAGVPIFLSALAHASGQDRDAVVLATNETQVARFALALRAAGLKQASIAEQIEALHPDADLQLSYERLTIDQAAMLVAPSAPVAGA